MGDADDAEFTELVHATSSRLYRSALLLSGDPHLAEDLVQTTYARLYAAWPRVRRAGNPLGYAHTTLTHAFLSHRRVRRNAEVPTEDLGEPTHVDDSSSRLDLLAALRTLTPLDRAVLVLRYWEDRSVADTAAELRLSETAVRTRARRALTRIRPLVGTVQKECS